MVFSSNIFLFFFLPAVLGLYYLCPARLRNLVLLLSSLFFYGWGEPVYLLLMLFTIAFNYAGGLLIAKRRARGENAAPVLALALAVNLGLLGFFKYLGLAVRTLRLLPGLGGLTVPQIALPIGISFYIFQSMSYLVDVCRLEAPAQRSFVRFGAYVAMFPQLIAGPIVRYRDIAASLDSRRENVEQFAAGVRLFVLGLSKKLLLANRMGALWLAMQGERGTLCAWVGILAYTLQIYFDFSGYSDMAIGLGRMFGFEFLKNFDYPYMAQSVKEFWRRWHISLGTWFKEYVYIPLGGSRRSLPRCLFNILVVWALSGIWHGASWNFLLWGLYYGLLLIAERLFLLRWLEKLPAQLRHLLAMLAVMLGWVLFYFETGSGCLAFFGRLFSLVPSGAHGHSLMLGYLPLLAVSVLAATPLFASLWRRVRDRRGMRFAETTLLALLFVLCTASLATQSYNPFIYFRF